MDCAGCVSRKPSGRPLVAEPREVSALRRIMRLHLGLWGLHEIAEAAQLCVTELVSNVITHVGAGTPTTLAVSMNGTYLRIEVQDPDTRALPTLIQAGANSEGGRGMALVDAIAEPLGYPTPPRPKGHLVRAVHGTDLSMATAGGCRGKDRIDAPRLRRSEDTYPSGPSPLSVAVAQEAAIDVIADLLHWLRVHGLDADEALDRAPDAL